MTVTGQPAVRLERTIPASPAQVYRAWLDPELLVRWMAQGAYTVTRAEVDERAGGHFRIWHADPSGTAAGGFDSELAELIPGQRIVFRWGFVGPQRRDGAAFDSLLTVTLRAAPDGETVLTLVHEGLDDLAAALPGVARNVGPGWEVTRLTRAFSSPFPKLVSSGMPSLSASGVTVSRVRAPSPLLLAPAA